MVIQVKNSGDAEAKPVSGSELAQVIAKIAKEKGLGVVMRGSEVKPVQRISTGVFEFDDATGGGIPMNRLVIIYGPESSGKSNICMGAARTVQRMPGPCNKVVWIDLEGTFDPKWVYQFGIDLNELIVVKPGYGEEAADIIDALLHADDVALVIVDSIAVITSAREVDASTEKADVGTAPMLVKRICNKIAMTFSQENRREHNPTVIFVNQTRFKLGVMYGDPENMPGGQTMKFMSALTVRLYGKNEIDKSVHPDLPAYKDTNAVIKKAKVPVNSVAFTYKMVLIPQPEVGLMIGDTDSWNYVSGYLKSIDALAKVPGSTGGWTLFEDKYQTLAAAREKYYSDPHFKKRCQDAVIKDKADKSFLIEPEGAAK